MMVMVIGNDGKVGYGVNMACDCKYDNCNGGSGNGNDGKVGYYVNLACDCKYDNCNDGNGNW